jgi:hypothetical protein
MRRLISIAIIAPLVLFGQLGAVGAEELAGGYGAAAGPGWAAAWLDLAQPQDFKKGDSLCFHIGGSRLVLVRFLPVGEDANQPVGIEGQIRSVPESGALRVDLAGDHARIAQISVHGGENAWTWKFSENNAAPAFTGVERISGDQVCK